MNDSNSIHRPQTIEQRLRAEVGRIALPRQPASIESVMRAVYAAPRRQPAAVSRRLPRTLWLTVPVAAALLAVVTWRGEIQGPSPSPRTVHVPEPDRLVPVLAYQEAQLGDELENLQADLNTLIRTASIRIEKRRD